MPSSSLELDSTLRLPVSRSILEIVEKFLQEVQVESNSTAICGILLYYLFFLVISLSKIPLIKSCKQLIHPQIDFQCSYI